MEIRTLRYFLAVARERNMTRAAAELYVTQPALSRQMAALEDEAGAPLFERSSHGLSLTDKGRLLFERAEQIVGLADQTMRDLSPESGAVTGDVRIGIGESYTGRAVAEAARALHERWPLVRFHLHDGGAYDLLDRLEGGYLDFCVLVHPSSVSDYDSVAMPGHDSWGLVMRRDNPLAAREGVTADDLASEPLIVSEQILHAAFSDSALEGWTGVGYDRLNIVGTYNLTFNATLFAEQGVASVLCLEGQIRSGESEALCFRPLVPAISVQSFLVWKKARAFSPAARAFLDAFREALCEEGGPGPAAR